MNKGVCPHCEKTLTEVIIEPVTAKSPRVNVRAITYSCPSCHFVLSVEIDPILLKKLEV